MMTDETQQKLIERIADIYDAQVEYLEDQEDTALLCLANDMGVEQ